MPATTRYRFGLKISLAAAALIACNMPLYAQDQDILDLATGAVIHSISTEYTTGWKGQWTAIAVLDGSVGYGWSSAQNAPFPHDITIELPGVYTLDTVTLNNTDIDKTQPAEMTAKGIELAVSTTGPTDGFTVMETGDMDKAGRTTFEIQDPLPARWLRITITSNWGHAEYTLLMEADATGTLTEDMDVGSVAGIYETSYGDMVINQDGDRISGCYFGGDGRLAGSASGRAFRVEWRQDEDRGSGKSGSSVMAISDTGELNGLWAGRGDNVSVFGRWTGHRKTTSTATAGEICPDEDLLRDLDKIGRVVLYGIRFEVDSAVLKPEAEPTLNRVLTALNADPDLQLTIEGHTDSSASDAYNLKLSDERSASVVNWLVTHGVDASRLSSAGKGEAMPVADNGTMQGRLLNRRVEIVSAGG